MHFVQRMHRKLSLDWVQIVLNTQPTNQSETVFFMASLKFTERKQEITLLATSLPTSIYQQLLRGWNRNNV
jgi:hypothetical protein